MDNSVQKIISVFFIIIVGHIYTERIPIKLSDLSDIPYPDVLHFYNQTLNGFQRLAKMFNPFKVTE